MALNTHPDDELLEGYSRGDISEEESVLLEEHLLVCEECRDRASRSDVYVKAMRSAARRLREKPSGLRRFAEWFTGNRLVWAVALATFVVLLIAGVQWRGRMVTAGAPVPIALMAMRGAPGPIVAPPGRALALTLDAKGLPALPAYRVEVVAETRRVVLDLRSVAPVNASISVSLPPLERGAYFVRVYGPPETLLREFALPVGT